MFGLVRLFLQGPSYLLLLKLPKQRCNCWILTEHLSVSTRLRILKLPFGASTGIHYTPRHSCCAHLPLSAAAPSCDQPEPTVPFVDTSIVGAVDGWSLKKICGVSIAAHCSLDPFFLQASPDGTFYIFIYNIYEVT